MTQPEVRRARVSGGELSYTDVGEGPAVVLLHGFPSSSFLWRREIPLLASRMRVIAPDLLGYGQSDKPLTADLTVEAQAFYVRELLERLEVERAAVVGHDIGGGVAQLLAIDPGFTVETLVLLDSVCFDVWPIEGVRMLQGATADQETEQFVQEVVRLTLDIGISHQGRVTEQDVERYVEPWRAEPPAFFRAARAIDGKGLTGREIDLERVDVPSFVLWGEEDPFLDPELAERLGANLAGSTVALLPGCSHFVNEDAPTTVGPLIYEFLRVRYLRDQRPHQSGPVQVLLHRPEPSDLAELEDE